MGKERRSGKMDRGERQEEGKEGKKGRWERR